LTETSGCQFWHQRFSFTYHFGIDRSGYVRFLEINPAAWAGLEETAASPEAKHHIGAVRPSSTALPLPPPPVLTRHSWIYVSASELQDTFGGNFHCRIWIKHWTCILSFSPSTASPRLISLPFL
jgi:hypothetical protein